MPRASAASLAVLSPAPQRAAIDAPAHLSPAERDIFLDIVSTCRPNHFMPSDGVLLAAYAAIAVEMQLATEQVREHGMVDGEGKITAWFSAQERLAKTMSILAHRLRLSPQGRSPTNPSRASRMSVYEEMNIGNHGTRPD